MGDTENREGAVSIEDRERLRSQFENIVDLCGVILEGTSHPRQQWFKYLATELKARVFTPTSLTFSYNEANHGFKSAYYNSLPQIFILLRDAMINLRYSEALTLLKALLSHHQAHMPLSLEMTVYRAGMEILYNTPVTEHTMVSEYVAHLRHLSSNLNPKQLMIEHTAFLLANDKWDEAKECAQQMPQVSSVVGKRVDTVEYFKLLQKCFAGYISYREWVKETSDDGSGTTELNATLLSDRNQAYTSVIDEMSLKRMAFEKDSLTALEELERNIDLCESPLDAFIKPYVHLLVSKGLKERAKDILMKNIDRTCILNPNTYRLFIDFLLEHREIGTPTELTTILKKYIEKWPSDLDYAEKLLDQPCIDRTDQLSILFNLLDYPANSDNVGLWIRLKNFIADSHTDQAKLKEQWDHRSSWWPSFHKYYHQGKDLQITIRNVLGLLNTVA